LADFSKVSVAVLAGGLGTRLRSVVDGRPKVLAEVSGRPFLAYLLEHLARTGVKSTVLCTGYLGEQISDRFGGQYGSVEIIYSRESEPLGTGGSLRLALPHLNSDPVLVLNGDSFLAADLRAFWAWHHERGAEASMLLTWVADSARYGSVELNDHGQVTEFREKAATDGPNWVNSGVYLLSRSLIASLGENVNSSLEYDLFPQLIGRALYGRTTDARFLDIGTPEDYASATAFFKQMN
jgi:D-glycero-alpha-D-manno-heptose 1-phosphate guanylyltransferase